MKGFTGTSGSTETLITTLQTLSPTSEYARGVLDMLRLLGIIHPASDQLNFIPTGKVAYMLIDILQAHLHDGVEVELPNGENGDTGLSAIDLLRAVEARRINRVAAPSAARVVMAAQCVIKGRKLSGEELYLMEYDQGAGWFQPIGGKKKPVDPDIEATLRRELTEELHLGNSLGPDDLAFRTLVKGWKSTHISPTYGILTAYTIDLFHVLKLQVEINVNECIQWLSRDEVFKGKATDGRAISTVYVDLLGEERLDMLKPAVIL